MILIAAIVVVALACVAVNDLFGLPGLITIAVGCAAGLFFHIATERS